MAVRKGNGHEAATLDDVVDVLGNLLRVVTSQGQILEQHSKELVAQREELRSHGEELRSHGEELRSHGEELRGQREELRGQREELRGQREELRGQREELRGQREELRLHRGLLEHVVEEQTLARAATELVAQRIDKLAEAILRGRSADLERAQSHELRILRLEQTVFGAMPPPGAPTR